MPRFPLLQLALFLTSAWNLGLMIYSSITAPETSTTAYQISFGTWFTCFLIGSFYNFIATKLDEMSWKTEAEMKKIWLQNQRLISAAQHNSTSSSR